MNHCQIMKRVVLLIVIVIFTAVGVSANETFDKGSEAFVYNRPQEAAILLEQSISDDPTNVRAYLYLALSYEQLSMFERAITVLKRAETVPGVDRNLVHFNVGNNYLQLGDAELAEESYGRAILANPLVASPYLNRANARVMLESYEFAVGDYRMVLELEPAHPQRPQIEQMIALLTDHVEQERIRLEEEQLRLEEEERQLLLEEQLRLEEEERLRQEAEARRRALLENVLDSIKDSTDDTTNLSAGNEDLDDYDDEDIDIAD